MLVARILEKAAATLHMLAVRVSDSSRQSEEQLVRDNQLYWQDRSNEVFEPFSHWRGKGPFENDELWLVSAEGGKPKRVDVSVSNMRNLSIHPGGRRLVFVASDWKSELWVMENFLPESEAAQR